MRSDPSETGGMFVGRRPGTAPVHFRGTPDRAGPARQRADRILAIAMLAGMTLLCLLCWGPIPIGCLWVAAQINTLTGSISLALLVAFIALGVLLFGALSILRRIDNAWVLVRRAAGYDQRTGILGRVFAITAAVCGAAFIFWFIVINGPGPGA